MDGRGRAYELGVGGFISAHIQYILYTCKYDVLITVYVELEISYNASVPENSPSSQLLICLLGGIDSGLVRKRPLSQVAFILINLAYPLGQGFPD
jgi:hypothetical protein